MSGVIAIVGRPNVGKSALFNRLAGRRIAIVHDQPGVTRDRVTAEVEAGGQAFTLIDTGGIGLVRGEKAPDAITAAALEQVQLALDAAQVIILVVNVQEGIVPLDAEVAARLRSTRKPVLVAVNKVDHDRAAAGVAEFSRLGFPDLFPVTAIHGLGIEALLTTALRHLPPPEPAPAAGGDPGPAPVGLAIVGRPNVGKSSLINALTGSTRVIVSPVPGTTRDSVDVPFEVDTEAGRQRYVLIDTAGVRKARRIDDTVEFFSVQRTEEAIGRCDIAVLVLDAEAGITEQDKKIADVIVEARRACIVVINKWDLMAESVRKAREEEVEARRDRARHRDDRRRRLTTLAEFGEWVQSKLFFLDYAPVIFTSATEGFQLERLLEAVRYVAAQLQQSVPTAIVNRTLRDAIERRQPVSDLGHRLTFYYATQVRQAPPTFLLFVNRDDLFSHQYTKYLADELRRAFGFEGCPIVIAPKPRPKTIDPVRRTRRRPFSEERAVRHAKPRAGGARPGRRPVRSQAGKGAPVAPGRKG
ncbi:MAG: ribosome biogenesis GTPase Der, partial [Verrucomicrobiota bacterium]